MSLAWFNGLLIAWSAIALMSFGSLLWKPAPYGRYFEPGWGRALNARRGWILMESPAVLVLPQWNSGPQGHVAMVCRQPRGA